MRRELVLESPRDRDTHPQPPILGLLLGPWTRTRPACCARQAWQLELRDEAEPDNPRNTRPRSPPHLQGHGLRSGSRLLSDKGKDRSKKGPSSFHPATATPRRREARPAVWTLRVHM